MNPAKRFNKWTVMALVVISAASPWLKPEQTSDIQQADALTILALGAIAAAVIAGLLLKPKVDAQKRDQRLPTTAQRGDQLGYVLGRRIVSGPPVWVGRRTSREERVSGGGKGGAFGGSGPKQIVYYEDGVHAIGLGPGSHLFRIIKNQSKVVFEGPITPDSTPSGSLLHDLEGNAFKIYWGEKFQPINTDLAGDDALGIASRWPYWMYIQWIQYREGTQATWPELEFDYASTCIGTPLPGSACNFAESAPGANDTGINGAHAIYQLCTGRFPHGGGMDPNHFDFGTLKALGARIQQERIPQNILIGGGATLMDILDDILADLGVFIVQDMDKILFMPIRPESSPPTLNDTIQVIPRAAYDVDHGAEQISNTLFLYPDIENQFYQTDVPANDDATARLFRRKRGQQVTMATITDKTTASIVSQRRKLLYLSDTNQLSLEVMRTARRLVPGQVAIFNGVGQLRITAIQRLATSGKAKLTAVVDQYALNSGGWNPNTGPGSGGPSSTTPDDAFLVFELPFDLVGRELAIGIVRIRKDGQGVPATVWVSTDGTTYNALGSQNISAAGFVASELPENSPLFVGQGPTLMGTTAAAAKVLDLTSSQAQWLTGSQLLILDSECLYLRSISSLGGGAYQTNGIVRKRLSTPRMFHGADSLCGVIAPDSITPFSHNSWGVGMQLWVKCQTQGMDLDDVVPVVLRLKGKALGGPPVSNLTHSPRLIGQDIFFQWRYRVHPGLGAGAGEIPYGEPLANTSPLEVGYFTIEILNALGISKRVENIGSNTTHYTYSVANQATDGINSGDPFTFRVVHKIDNFGGYDNDLAVPGAI